MIEEDYDIKRLAHHEAAHAVVAIRLGQGQAVDYITIAASGDNGDIWGHAMIQSENHEDPGLMEAIDEVMINIAGQVAEDIITGTLYKDSQIHSDADRENIALFVGFCMSDQSEIDLFLAWLYERTRLLLIGLWPWVEVVAHALLEHNTLSGDEVREICFRTPLPN